MLDRQSLQLRIAVLLSVVLFIPALVSFVTAEPGAVWPEYSGVLFHLTLLLVISQVRSPAWARAAGYGWITLDVLAGILAINAIPHQLVWPVRLSGHVLAGLWLVTTSALSRRWPLRIVGVVTGLDLGLYSFVATRVPLAALYPSSNFACRLARAGRDVGPTGSAPRSRNNQEIPMSTLDRIDDPRDGGAVLVVGAGPVGLTAALQLAGSGVPVRLIDAKHGPATTSRALATHARTLEIYDQMGVLADIAPQGTRINAFVRHVDNRAGRIDFAFGDLATRFPYVFMIDQAITERVLRGHAAAAGIQVEWDTALVSFTQNEDGVTAVLQHTGNGEEHEETTRTPYLWGCDGGHSVVRKSLGLKLDGEAAHTWLIADALVETNVDRDGLHWLFPPGGAMMLFPFPDPHKWRLLDTSGQGDPDRPEEVAARLTNKLSAALGRDTTVAPPTWISIFTIQQRAVPSMHVGRCFVSGDAAHVHSPASGQGMNTGIQDAYNLAWKLAMVLRGDADAGLLATYDAERVPIGQALLRSTGEVMATAMTDADEENTAQSDYAFMQRLIRGMSGLAIAYPDSPLTIRSGSEDSTSQVAAGERLTQVDAASAEAAGWIQIRRALQTCFWHLITSAANVPADSAALPSWVSPITLDDATDPQGVARQMLGLTDGGWILTRPDGYVAARGTEPDTLRDALHHLEAFLAA